jgi:post-segregation antitoxin (ccd killing protein)
MRSGRKRSSVTGCRFESLEDRLNFSWSSTPPSSVNSPSSSTAVTLDSQGDASGIASILSTEIDWYRFTATTTGTYAFEASTPSSSLDTVLGVYKSSGKRVGYNDDISNSDTDSRKSMSLEAGKTYLFGITNYKGTAGGAYSWKIDGPALPSTDDAYENNDSQSTASSLGAVTSPRTITGLKMADAADWFSFTTSAAGTSASQVSISFTQSQGDLDLRLYNSSGTQIGQSVGTTNQEVVSLNGLGSGTYYVQAFGKQGAQNSNYSLTITPPTSSPPPSTQDAWTVFVYITASNLQEFAYEDINEMEVAVSQLPSTVNVVTLWDQSAAYSTYSTGNGSQAAWKTTGRAVITGDTNMSRVATQFEILAEQNTGSPVTLQNFLTWGAATAPAQHYALVMWNHGAGLDGSNYDDSDNAGSDHLTISEVASALGASGVPAIDVFSYDACLMAMAEVGYGLKDRAQMFAASEELEGGPGHDYRTLFNVLKTNPTSVTAEQLANGFVTSYGTQYVGTGVSEDTYSATRTSLYNSFAGALKSFTDSTLNAASSVRTALQTARNNAVAYDDVDFRDLGSFMRNVSNATSVSSAIRTAASGVLTAISSLVSSRTSDGRSSSGVSIYLPKTSLDSSYASTFSAFNSATNWGSFANWLITGSRTAASSASSSISRGPAERAIQNVNFAVETAIDLAFAASRTSEWQTAENAVAASDSFISMPLQIREAHVADGFDLSQEFVRTVSSRSTLTATARTTHDAALASLNLEHEACGEFFEAFSLAS